MVTHISRVRYDAKLITSPCRIAISIMALEIFTIVLPCWQVMRHQTLQKETLEAIKLWEEKSKIGSINDTDYSGSTKISKSAWESFKAMSAFESGRPSLDHPESIFTMAALERALKLNAEPLRHFAALRDFSGENINFLTDLAAWKSQWSTEEGKKSMQVDETVHRKLYNRAIHIYANLVSPLYAEFPINISSPELKALEDVFEHAARILYGERSSFSSGSEVTPFDERWGHTDSKEFIMSPTSTTFAKADSEREISVADETPINFISDKVQYWGDIPADFNRNVFNRAEKSIKYLVLTNTWPKFVRSGGDETESGRSSLDRVSKYFRNMW